MKRQECCVWVCVVGSNLIYSLAQRSNRRFAISYFKKQQITGGLEGRVQHQKVKRTNDRLFDYCGSSFFKGSCIIIIIIIIIPRSRIHELKNYTLGDPKPQSCDLTRFFHHLTRWKFRGRIGLWKGTLDFCYLVDRCYARCVCQNGMIQTYFTGLYHMIFTCISVYMYMYIYII